MAAITVEPFRAERAEAAYWATYARNIATTVDTRDTGAIPVAGGFALCLQGTSIAYGLGVGVGRALREDDLRIVDEFYDHRKLVPQLELHPGVVERDARLLLRWGYHPQRQIAVLERDVEGDLPSPSFAAETLTSRPAEWAELVAAGFADVLAPADLDRLRRTTAACARAASALLAIRLDGRLAGGGAVGIIGDVAFLYCAATLPEFRRRGVYRGVTGARLALARSRGATYAFTSAPLDGPACEGAQSAGFALAYVRERLAKEAPRST